MATIDDDFMPNEHKRRRSGEQPAHFEVDGSYDGEERLTVKKCLMQNLLVIFLFIAMVVGVVMGFLLRQYHWTAREIMYLKFPGEMLMRMLKMMILPLIVSSLISSIAKLPGKAAGKMGGFTVCYYLLTTVLAVLLGILLVMTIRPGKRGTPATCNNRDTSVSPIDSLLDLIRNAFPDNLLEACFRTDETKLAYNVTSGCANSMTVTPEKISLKAVDRMNILGVVVFCIFFGIVLSKLGKRAYTVVDFFQGVQDGVIILVRLIIWYSPIGIVFLLAARIVAMDNPEHEFKSLMWYAITVLAGLGIHAFVFLPIIYLIFTRKNPFVHMWHMSQALCTALATASSAATLPITMRCLEDKAKVKKSVSRFVLPVGATVNMDGTALYEAVAVIFIGQVNGEEMDVAKVIVVALTATLAAIGAAGIPEAGLVTMLIVLSAVNFPLEGVEMIYAIDWFLDRCRTSVNVWGDSVGAGVVERLVRGDIHDAEDIDEEKD